MTTNISVPKNAQIHEIDDFILINFKSAGSFDKAVEWAKENGLSKTIQQDVLDLSEKYPSLNKTIRMNYMYLFSTTDFTFDGVRQACYVWWVDAKRGAGLYWLYDFDGRCGWFVFRKSKLGARALDSAPSETLTLDAAIARVKEGGYKVIKEI